MQWYTKWIQPPPVQAAVPIKFYTCYWTRLRCFYCKKESIKTCYTDLAKDQGIDYCEDHALHAIRDTKAYLHTYGSVRIVDALQHNELNEFIMLFNSFHSGCRINIKGNIDKLYGVWWISGIQYENDRKISYENINLYDLLDPEIASSEISKRVLRIADILNAGLYTADL
jgi:hypothetical protein